MSVILLDWRRRIAALVVVLATGPQPRRFLEIKPQNTAYFLAGAPFPGFKPQYAAYFLAGAPFPGFKPQYAAYYPAATSFPGFKPQNAAYFPKPRRTRVQAAKRVFIPAAAPLVRAPPAAAEPCPTAARSPRRDK
ncbi:hypothetical protein [Cohnella nanjingensis]|nr:hypothetical protein [Cohnella nanjingensis]